MPLMRWPTEVIGTVGNDGFNAAENTVFFGRSGNDVFYAIVGVPSGFTEPGDPLFFGGTGNDTYVLANDSEVVVAESGNSPADVVIATGLGFNSPNTYLLTINGRHLAVGDFVNGQSVIVLDWQVPANRIETIVLADGTFTFAQIQAAVFASPNYLGDYTWEFFTGGTYSTADVNEAINFYASRSAFLESKRPPVVTPGSANVSLLHGVSAAASTLFTTSDPDGDAIQKYEFWDGGGGNGYFSAFGALQAANVAIPVSAGSLAGIAWVAGQAPAVETVWVRAYDGVDWSSWASWTMTTLSRPPVATPTAAEIVVPTGQSVAASTLFTASDADGDAIQQYEFWDGGGAGGYFRVGGVQQPSGQSVPVSPAQLAGVAYVGGATPTAVPVSETVWVRAYDGILWGPWLSWTMVSQRTTNVNPVVTAPNRNIDLNQWRLLNEIFSVSDADGDSPVRYEFIDDTAAGGSGYLWVNGLTLPAGTTIAVDAAGLGNVWVRGGSVGGTDSIRIRATDGYDAGSWSSWTTLSLSTRTQPNRPPVADATNNAVQVGQTAFAGTLFGISDPDGDAPVSYELWDGSAGAGKFRVDGVDQAARVAIPVSAAQLAQTVYVAGTGPGSETLWVRAYDGQAWSGWEDWTMFTHNSSGNSPPAVNATNRNIDLNQWRRITELVTVSDLDANAINQLQVRDATATAGSGYLWADGASYGQGATVTTASLADTWVRGGATAGSNTYDVRAFDGIAWSNWSSFSLNTRTQPNRGPVVTATAPVQNVGIGGNVAANALFAYSDADTDAAFSFELWDSGAGAGHLSINAGPAQASGVAIPLSPAQLAATQYVGASSGSETLWARAYDGQAWSDWKSWAMNVA